MGVRFNADEILAMAVEIERNGQKFYRRGAEIAGDEGVKKLMTELVDWEKGHEKLFESMRSELSDEEKFSTAFDPDGEAELFLQAMADTHVFNVNKDAAALLGGDESPGDILKTALGFERDSIVFFMGMEKMVPERLGGDRVRKIIDEEIRHVAYLKRELNKVKG